MLILYLKDGDKLHQVIPNILHPCLSDPSDEIVATTQNGLLLSVAYRLAMADLNHLLQTTLHELNESCQNALEQNADKKVISQSLSSTIHQSGFAELSNNAFSGGLGVGVMYKLQTCQYLLPFVISYVIKSAPFYPEEENNSNSSANVVDENDDESTLNVNMDNILPMLFKTKQNATNYLETLQDYLAREWYESWFQLKWISDVLLVSMIESATKIPVPVELCRDNTHKLHNDTNRSRDINVPKKLSDSHFCSDSLILQYVHFFRELTLVLGPNYTNKSVISKLEDQLPILSNFSEESDQNDEETQNNDDGVYSSSLLPIYVLGVLSNMQTACQLTETIRKWCIMYCLKGLSTHPLVFSIQYILTIEKSKQHSKNDEWYSEIRDALSEMAWSLLVHSSSKIRVFSGIILDILASCGK